MLTQAANITVTCEEEDVVAHIGGGSRRAIGQETVLQLDASGSYDPEAGRGPANLSCVSMYLFVAIPLAMVLSLQLYHAKYLHTSSNVRLDYDIVRFAIFNFRSYSVHRLVPNVYKASLFWFDNAST